LNDFIYLGLNFMSRAIGGRSIFSFESTIIDFGNAAMIKIDN